MNQSKQGITILNSQIIYASQIEKILNDVLNNEEIKAIIISMNSPGGSVSGSNRLYNAIKDFKKNNTIPIYIHTNELLASGAFWSSVAANKIYASYGSMIGSIGVKGPSWFVYNKPKSIRGGLLEPTIETEEGIEHYQPFAGKSKDVFNPFRKPTEEELFKIQNLLIVLRFLVLLRQVLSLCILVLVFFVLRPGAILLHWLRCLLLCGIEVYSLH